MATAMVHCNTHTLSEHLDEAVHDYRALRGHLPPRVTVHKSLLEEARQTLREMNVVNVAVEGLGGCLANEIWLWLPDDEEAETKG
jgi:hypothetical protein